MGNIVRRTVAIVLMTLAVVGLAGCGGGDAGGAAGDRPAVVVTTTVLGAVVRDLVGDAAEVRVILPEGVDPHEFQPSARDAEALGDADLIVTNGLGLEAGLADAIDRVRDDGVPVVTATDEVDLIRVGGAEDPHVWMDPLRMRTLVGAVAGRLEAETGVRLGDRVRRFQARLTALDDRVRRRIERIPAARRRLVTGHESLGYYADRYGLTLVGAVLPGLSSQAEASAARVARLRETIARARVPAVFTETGFPPALADTVADETGVPVIEVATETLPEDASYASFIEAATDAFVRGLAPEVAP